MSRIVEKIREDLHEMEDLAYRDFQAGLIPSMEKEHMIGVRTPNLRKYAKTIAKEPQIGQFLAELPHRYYEENNLHALLLAQITDYDTCLEKTEAFLPYIDNWATCDILAPKVFAKQKEKLLPSIRAWICAEQTYTVRFGLGMLMRFFLDADFREEYLEMAGAVRSEEYYVNMMIAWYFATALAKQYTAALPWLENRRLEPWTHNKTIQKACESYRLTPEQKAYLRTLRVKR